MSERLLAQIVVDAVLADMENGVHGAAHGAQLCTLFGGHICIPP